MLSWPESRTAAFTDEEALELDNQQYASGRGIFRPAAGFGRAETPVQNVYLGSAGANPGGGVHGACGRNAARAALASDGARGWPRRRLTRALQSLTTR